MPYSSMPEASAPSTKYFIAASVEAAESRFSATIAYRHSDSSSRPRYRVRKLLALAITIMPSSANSSSADELAAQQAAVEQVLARIDQHQRYRAVGRAA